MKITNRHLILVSALLGCGSLLFAGVKTVNVKVPGTLAQKVGEKNKYTTKALKIKGSLNADDVKFLRDMAGGDTVFKSTPGILVDIDLTDVTFSPGPKSFLTMKSSYKIKGQNSIPETFLYNCPVERVVLPLKLDSIGNWAFSDTKLKEFIVPDGVFLAQRDMANDSA